MSTINKIQTERQLTQHHAVPYATNILEFQNIIKRGISSLGISRFLKSVLKEFPEKKVNIVHESGERRGGTQAQE